jgi:L-fuconate dehydratase
VTRIVGLRARDIRAPTSRTLAGSDAVHVDPDYSAAYVTLETDRADGLEGNGFTFTIGRGNELCVAAAEALAPLVVGRTLESITGEFGRFWAQLTGDSQLRWLGPEKGVIHLATAAVVNALWDLYARVCGKPLWKLIVDMSPEQIVSCVDFRHIDDVLPPERALEILQRNAPGRAEREAEMRREGHPAYLTSAGWIGYPEQKLRRLCREALAAGWSSFKIKVGLDLDSDVRRCEVMREEIGDRCRLMMDANQVWSVDQAIEHMRVLARFDPYWIEEPTHPDDVLGHARIRRALSPIGVATGEHCANRVLFKQLMQAQAIDFCQIDACRLGGVNEVLAVLLLAAHFGVPVCPHAGGLGLCEYVQHLSLVDYICIGASLENRMTEYAEHLHEHFVDPVVIEKGRYRVPNAPGYSARLRAESIEELEFPHGRVWAT